MLIVLVHAIVVILGLEIKQHEKCQINNDTDTCERTCERTRFDCLSIVDLSTDIN